MKSWCLAKLTPAFIAQMEAILNLYQQPYNPQRPQVCFDEKSVQLLAHPRPPLPVQPGQPRREDYEYKRAGTRNLFVFVEPQAGQRHLLVTRRRTKQDFAQVMRYLVDVLYPEAECVDLVLDNLNTHHYHSLVEAFGKVEADRIASRICFHFTPAHASWLNMAEIELSVLSQQCLDRRLADEWTLAMELLAWEQTNNALARKINWSFSIDDAKHVFADFYSAS
ncbi:MAG TPA: IS630 family transposase [Anaerolineae bacterium]|nr:IS630 family transposase [Anaerolineae bacterium]